VSYRGYCALGMCLLFLTPLLLRAEGKGRFIADVHGEAGVACVDCHGVAVPKEPATGEQCLKCHESYKEVAKRTVGLTPNPHENHIVTATEPDCTECHQGHKARKTLCVECHSDIRFVAKP